MYALGIIANIGKAQAEDAAKIMEAFADTLPAFLEAALEDEAFGRKVFVPFEAVVKVGAAKKIQRYPLRPTGIVQEVETLREAKKSKSKVKVRPDSGPKG
ncbi:hypothetical protein [Ruegeria sp. AU67]|uniref:hypothetical protein n=1 Tax=Ruegeria sp. AU67 TaxID=2108530 RepID=UPI000D69CD30|nr:hypothetical protein [Ruegeria sp. AU67]